MTLWTATPEWEGETAFIVCGGPSLRGFDFERLRGRKVIAINSSFRALPFADFLLFCDSRWWIWNCADALKFPGRIVTVIEDMNRKTDARILRMKKMKPPGLTEDRTGLTMSRTSLTAGLNLAKHLGGALEVLLGADMQKDGEGHTHHHAPHPQPSKVGCWNIQMQELKTTAKPLADAGIGVINTSMASRIDWWPKQELDTLL